jgi:DMSO/TMAO reductase YedYZ heme-binding membrane subunit
VTIILNLPFFGWLGLVAALFFLITILTVSYKKLYKPKLRIKIHHIFIQAAAAFVLAHIIIALTVYLPYLPFFVWFGIIAALLFIAASVVVLRKGLVKPKAKMKVHKLLALLGAAFALVHIYLALSVYF